MAADPITTALSRREIVAEIWARAFLFHPTAVAGAVDWEGELERASTTLDDPRDDAELVEWINGRLLHALGDPLTFASLPRESAPAPPRPPALARLADGFDLLELRDPRFLLEPHGLTRLDGLLRQAAGHPLVVDLRWSSAPPGVGATPVLGFFTDSVLPGSVRAQRVHEGWSEEAHAYVFAHRFEVEQGPPLFSVRDPDPETRRRIGATDFGSLTTVRDPTLFVVDDASAFVLRDGLAALRARRRDVDVVWERTGDAGPRSGRHLIGGIALHLNPRLEGSFYSSARPRVDVGRAAAESPAFRPGGAAVPELPRIPLQSSFADARGGSGAHARLAEACKIAAVLAAFFPFWDRAKLSPAAFRARLLELADLPAERYQAGLASLLAELDDPHAALLRGGGWRSGRLIPRVRPARFDWTASPRPVRRLDDGIGYLAPFELTRVTELHRALDELADAPGIVLDLRDYPRRHFRAALLGRLCRQPVCSPVYGTPVVRADGVERWMQQSFTIEPCGRSYDGEVVALIDGRTMCAAEDVCVLLRSAGRATFVGEATAGAQGNAADLRLRDGLRLMFTGMRVHDRAGRPLSREPILPDVSCPSEQALGRARELVLQRIGTTPRAS